MLRKTATQYIADHKARRERARYECRPVFAQFPEARAPLDDATLMKIPPIYQNPHRECTQSKCAEFVNHHNATPTSSVLVFTSPPGGGLDPAGAYDNSAALRSGQILYGSTSNIPTAVGLEAGPGIVITPTTSTVTISATGTFTGDANDVAYFGPTGALTGAALTNGQLLVGRTAAAPVATTITPGTGITVTNTPGAITIASTGGATGTPKTVAEFDNTGALSSSAPLANGQLLVGSTGNAPAATTLTAGAGISITNNPGAITITSTAVTTGPPKTVAIFDGTGTLSSATLTNAQLLIGSTGNAPATATVTQGPGITISNNPGAIAVSAAPTITVQALTDAPTISWDASLGTVGTVTIAGNRALSNPTNVTTGMLLTLQVTQDATGSRSMTFGTAYQFVGSQSASNLLNYVPAATDTLVFYAQSPTQLVCIRYSSSQTNWSQFTGKSVGMPPQLIDAPATLASIIGSVALDTSRVLCVYRKSDTNLYGAVATIDSAGRLTVGAPMQIDTAITIASNVGSTCISLNANQAIISYKKTVTAVVQLFLCALNITGTTITVGTPLQVTSVTAVQTGPGNNNVLCGMANLNTTDFVIMYKTNFIVTARWMTCNGSNVITAGTTPFTVNTDTAAVTFVSKLLVRTSTSVYAIYQTASGATTLKMNAAIINVASSNVSSVTGAIVLSTIPTSQIMDAGLTSATTIITCFRETSAGSQRLQSGIIVDTAGTLVFTSTLLTPPYGAQSSFTCTLLGLTVMDAANALLYYQVNATNGNMVGQVLQYSGTAITAYNWAIDTGQQNSIPAMVTVQSGAYITMFTTGTTGSGVTQAVLLPISPT